jgi:hypothetical protein
LSLVSPRRPRTRVLRGRDAPAPFGDAGFVVERVVGDAALVVEHLDVRVGDELVRVAVAGDDHDVDPVGRGRVASVAITSSASTPDLELLISSASSTSWISGSCDAKRSGVSLRPALYSESSSLRYVLPPGASNATAMWSGCSSATTLVSIDVKP